MMIVKVFAFAGSKIAKLICEIDLFTDHFFCLQTMVNLTTPVDSEFPSLALQSILSLSLDLINKQRWQTCMSTHYS